MAISGIPWPAQSLVWMVGCLLVAAAKVEADTWAAPHDEVFHSENGQCQFSVAIGGIRGNKPASGILRRKSGDTWVGVWTNRLVNRVRPVSVMVANSGRHVVTLDEYHAVGTNPVVIYDEHGTLVTNLPLSAFELEDHPRISRSVSSYWWNQNAIMLFGPPAKPGGAVWERTLEDSLFIRLFWGDVIQIDLASSRVRDDAWWRDYSAEHAGALKREISTYLNSRWLRLAREYFRSENFAPDPKGEGVTGMLLVGQLRFREALPLLRTIAATERFEHWAAPSWESGGRGNVRDLARAVIAELERSETAPNKK